MKQKTFTLQEWDERHPRWSEFIACLEAVAPEQTPFVSGDYYKHSKSYLCVAIQADEVVGFLRFAVQMIGPEAKCPPLELNGEFLTEAKIHAFAVREDKRNQGIGTELQKWAIERGRELNCYQLASYSSYGRESNYHIKLSLGFGAQPEVHGDNEQGVYFIMPLQGSSFD